MASSFQLFDLDAPSGGGLQFHLGPRDGGRIGYCISAVTGYWRARCLAAGVTYPMAELPPSVEKVGWSFDKRALQFGVTAARLPCSNAAYALASLYTSRLELATRSRFGVYYTPPVLVDRLLAMATAAGVDWTNARILDPACGGGAFLAPVANRMADLLTKKGVSPREAIRHISNHLSGVEIDPFAAWLAQVLAEASLLEMIAHAGVRLNKLVHTGDSLDLATFSGDDRFDLVIGNPPYGRVTLPGVVRERFRESLFGHANYYGIFTHLALSLMQPRGVVAYVTPSSFLSGQYFESLRRLLARHARMCSLDFITDRARVFDDVLQETLLVVFRRDDSTPLRNGDRQRVSVSSVTPIDGGAACAIKRVGSVATSMRDGKPWLFPRERGQVALLRSAVKSRYRLRDYGYSVSTGPLVWNRRKHQLRERATSGCLPLIWSEAVRPNGEFRFSAARRNHEPFFRVEPGQDHLVIRRPCVLVQRTTAKEQPRRLVTAYLPATFVEEYGGIVVENHLNVILPMRSDVAIPPLALVSLLNSTILDQVFRCISGSVAVSAYELESMPLPNPNLLADAAESSILPEAAIRRAYGLRR